MVMSQSLFKLLKQRDPNVMIDVLAPAWSMPLLARMPEVAESLIMPIGHGKFGWNERRLLGKNLREKQYKQAIVLRILLNQALIPWWANFLCAPGFVVKCVTVY